MDHKLAELRRVLRLHISWLTVVLLGKEVVSKEDLAELKKYGRPPLDKEVSFIEKAFALGRLSATSKKADYDDLTLEKLSMFEKFKYSSIEKLSIREAKLHAYRHIQSIADEVAADVVSSVNEATESLIDKVMMQMTDELSAAVAEEKTAKELASILGNVFNSGMRINWTRFAVTELHRAKVRGAAMAIANKVSIYKKSDGVDSNVSVVPNKNACDDCLNLYLDASGNPRVVKLKELIGRGTNAAPGIKHTRDKTGLHNHWKAVMPPAHPNCYCMLEYVPPGMIWLDGKLVIEDKLMYKQYISKAVDKGSMGPTIKPPGPKSTQGPKPPKPPSMPGLPAPGNMAGSNVTTAPESAIPTNKQPEQQVEGGAPGEMVECPFGGGVSCTQHGGNGAEHHMIGGSIMKKHNEYQENTTGPSSEEEAQKAANESMANSNWNYKDYKLDTVMGHLKDSKVVSKERLNRDNNTEAASGVNESYKGRLQGNGPVMMKFDSDTAIRYELAAYSLISRFDASACPPAAKRVHDGRSALFAAWASDFTSGEVLDKALPLTKGSNQPGGFTKHMLDKAKDPKSFKKKVDNIIAYDIVMNNGDRHSGNYMVNNDFSDLRAVDHGFMFSSNLDGYDQHMHRDMHSIGMHARLSPELNEALNNTSLFDLQRDLGDNVEDWQVAQSYLRMRYAQSIQEEHGNLGLKHFSDVAAVGDPSWTIKSKKRLMVKDKFQDFSLDFIDTHSEDSSSIEHAAATHMREIGSIVYSDSDNRKDGEHFLYEKEVRLNRYLADNRLYDEKQELYDKLEQVRFDSPPDINVQLEEGYNKERGIAVRMEQALGKVRSVQNKAVAGKPMSGSTLKLLEAAEAEVKAVRRDRIVHSDNMDKLYTQNANYRNEAIHKLLASYTPPELAEKFSELDSRREYAMSNRKPKKVDKKDYSSIRTAASIEKKKREQISG